MPRQQKQGLDRFFVIDRGIPDTVHLVKQGVLRTDSRIVQTAGIGIYRCRIVILICEHDAVETMHHALCSIGYGCCMVSHCRSSSQGFHTDQFNRIRQERREHAD